MQEAQLTLVTNIPDWDAATAASPTRYPQAKHIISMSRVTKVVNGHRQLRPKVLVVSAGVRCLSTTA